VIDLHADQVRDLHSVLAPLFLHRRGRNT
jgi:hypothetical protein